MPAALAIALSACVLLFAFVFAQAARRHVFIWLPAYLRGNWPGRRERRPAGRGAVTHVMLCIADHFEPGWRHADDDQQARRVNRWVEQYPALFDAFRDADGRPPRHTFFYPIEQYRPEHLDGLARLVEAGFGEVEVHLHHDSDTSDGLRATLRQFLAQLDRHGMPGRDVETGRPLFAFAHGNWALDNSLPDGRWCGVNDELQVLRECGCYADFTLPAAPSPAQTRRINSIYYATDDPARPRSHDDGVPVRTGGAPAGDLMIVQGPLGVRWPGRTVLQLAIENADLCTGAPPTAGRVRAWLNARVCVAGRPDWLFVKLHTHGCKEANTDLLLGPRMQDLHRHLWKRYNDGVRYKLHYVTAREMYNIIKAAERGLTGEPGEYRDLVVAPPRAAGRDAPPVPRTEAAP